MMTKKDYENKIKKLENQIKVLETDMERMLIVNDTLQSRINEFYKEKYYNNYKKIVIFNPKELFFKVITMITDDEQVFEYVALDTYKAIKQYEKVMKGKRK